jgi:hypothetical protein
MLLSCEELKIHTKVRIIMMVVVSVASFKLQNNLYSGLFCVNNYWNSFFTIPRGRGSVVIKPSPLCRCRFDNVINTKDV